MNDMGKYKNMFWVKTREIDSISKVVDDRVYFNTFYIRVMFLFELLPVFFMFWYKFNSCYISIPKDVIQDTMDGSKFYYQSEDHWGHVIEGRVSEGLIDKNSCKITSQRNKWILLPPSPANIIELPYLIWCFFFRW